MELSRGPKRPANFVPILSENPAQKQATLCDPFMQRNLHPIARQWRQSMLLHQFVQSRLHRRINGGRIASFELYPTSAVKAAQVNHIIPVSLQSLIETILLTIAFTKDILFGRLVDAQGTLPLCHQCPDYGTDCIWYCRCVRLVDESTGRPFYP